MKTKLQLPLAIVLVFLTFPLQQEPPEPQEALTQPTPIQEVIPPEPPTLTVKAKVETEESDNVMEKIAWCESRNRQFNEDGSVLRGEYNPQDVGKYQINEKYHLSDSIRLGYDIYTLEGNEGYAMHLYRTQGTTPWNWSKPCWSK